MRCIYCKETFNEYDLICPHCNKKNKLVEIDNPLYKEAKNLLVKGNFLVAKEKLSICSKYDDTDAMMTYALLFENNVSKNKDRNILYCYEKAAERKNPYAIFQMIDSCVLGNYGKEINFEEAKAWINLLPINYKNDILSYYEDVLFDGNENGMDVVANFDLIMSNIKEEEFVRLPEFELDEELAFEEEKKHLADVVDVIDKTILKHKEDFVRVDEYQGTHDEDARLERFSQIKNNERISEKIYKLKNIKENPYFGRVIYSMKDGQFYDIYIGKEVVTDHKNRTLIFSWLSQAANIYYNKNGSDDIKILCQRDINIKDSKLLNIHTNIYNGGYVSINADDYLKQILLERREQTEVTDIIKSIQMNQHQIISENINSNFVVQGCAGSGKSMILYHRIKFLIGNKILKPFNVCVLSPNSRLNKQIKPLTRTLGIDDISIMTMTTFYRKLITLYLSRFDTLLSGYYLDNKNTYYFSFKNIKIRNDDDLDEDIVNYIYSKELMEKVDALSKVKINQINIANFEKKKYIDDENNFDILGALLGKKEISLLPNYERKFGVIHKCEMYFLLLLLYKRCGFKKYVEKDVSKNDIELNYDYYCIDEVQDFSPQELTLIKSIKNKKDKILNIYGDVNQRINKWGIYDWNELYLGNLKLFRLNENYRNTQQICDYANICCGTNMKNFGINGKEVKQISMFNILSEYAEIQEKNPNYKSIIICKKEIKYRYENYNMFIKTFSPNEVKGMEYQVTFVDLEGMNENEKYVSLTRATHTMFVIES